MPSVSTLLDARDQYELHFASLPIDLETVVERHSDHDLPLSQCAFAANKDSRRIQITLEDEAVPCAFLKKTGVDLEIMLVHVIVSVTDLRIDACKRIFDEWIVKLSPLETVTALAARFE